MMEGKSIEERANEAPDLLPGVRMTIGHWLLSSITMLALIGPAGAQEATPGLNDAQFKALEKILKDNGWNPKGASEPYIVQPSQSLSLKDLFKPNYNFVPGSATVTPDEIAQIRSVCSDRSDYKNFSVCTRFEKQ
jgi:hypothetical protein